MPETQYAVLFEHRDGLAQVIALVEGKNLAVLGNGRFTAKFITSDEYVRLAANPQNLQKVLPVGGE